MEWNRTKRGLELPVTVDFDLAQTLECGQCFRWEKRDGRFWGVAGGRSLCVWEDGGRIVLEGAGEQDAAFWADYFDLSLDYAAVRTQLCREHPALAPMAAFAPGIRILRQEPWETLCSFILSQNNNIPRIQAIVRRLCEGFGEQVGRAFAFPGPERLAGLTEEMLAPLRSGFRARYLLSAARLVAGGQVDLQALFTLPMEQARASLRQIVGVGEKVAECVLLYGLHRLEAFPMDVWMKRAMKSLFPGLTPEDFGAYAGIAQQYIFHYSRSHPERFS